MNYLAHAFLSFHQPDILVGNMISDFVKGRKKFDYSPAIQKGITLHRAIDEFTDFHPVTNKAKQFFRPVYRLYSAVFTDVLYDHFLANDPALFPDSKSLAHFAAQTYQVLSAYKSVTPGNFNRMLPYMISHNWLYNYQFREGIRNSFHGLVRRAQYLDESDIAFAIFEKHYEDLKQCYQDFFPELKDFACNTLQLL
ncbi:MAG: ACP phosphodiesterase [Chitinophagaceae bacterium]